MNKNSIWFVSLILLAALSRIIPHPPNFTIVGALALFGGSMIPNRTMKFVIPLIALFLSDLVLNNTIYASEGFSVLYPGMVWIYASFVIIAAMGMTIKSFKVSSIAIGSVSAALFFFVFTNFGYWMSGVLYPLTATGLVACYSAALPFFGNTLASTVIYSTILFGGYYFILRSKLISAKA